MVPAAGRSARSGRDRRHKHARALFFDPGVGMKAPSLRSHYPYNDVRFGPAGRLHRGRQRASPLLHLALHPHSHIASIFMILTSGAWVRMADLGPQQCARLRRRWD